MNRIFILEGMDSSGKTSLAKFLALNDNAVYLHASGVCGLHESMWEYHEDLLQNAEANIRLDHDVIIDRHWPSEWCYAGVLRQNLKSRYDFQHMAELCKKLEVTYVFCDSADSYARHLVSHDKHDHYLPEIYDKIQDNYRVLFSQLSHVKYSIEDHGHDLHTFRKMLYESHKS